MVCEIAADERPTVPGLLAEIEEEITELPLRMTVRTLCSLSKNCESEMRRVYGRDEMPRHYATVFFETRKVVQALASANTGTSTGRLCDSILKGMRTVDESDCMSRANGGDHAGLLVRFLEMFETLCAEIDALAMDDGFIELMGPNGRQTFLKIAASIRASVPGDLRRLQ